MTSHPMPARLRALLRVEDLLLAVVGVVGVPLVTRLSGSGTGGSTSDTPPPLVGWFGLLAILGVLACLLTRGAGEPPPFGDGRLTFQGWARFPLVAGVGIVGLETLPAIGLDGDPFVGITVLVVTVSVLAYAWLPVVPVVARRAMVTPMAMLAAGAFDDMMGSGLGSVTRGLLLGQAPAGMTAFLPLFLGVVGALYAILVAAPRAIADPGASGLAWVVRFLFLLAAVAFGDLVFGPAG
jgi:hypothetical protein